MPQNLQTASEQFGGDPNANWEKIFNEAKKNSNTGVNATTEKPKPPPTEDFESLFHKAKTDNDIKLLDQYAQSIADNPWDPTPVNEYAKVYERYLKRTTALGRAKEAITPNKETLKTAAGVAGNLVQGVGDILGGAPESGTGFARGIAPGILRSIQFIPEMGSKFVESIEAMTGNEATAAQQAAKRLQLSAKANKFYQEMATGEMAGIKGSDITTESGKLASGVGELTGGLMVPMGIPGANKVISAAGKAAGLERTAMTAEEIAQLEKNAIQASRQSSSFGQKMAQKGAGVVGAGVGAAGGSIFGHLGATGGAIIGKEAAEKVAQKFIKPKELAKRSFESGADVRATIAHEMDNVKRISDDIAAAEITRESSEKIKRLRESLRDSRNNLESALDANKRMTDAVSNAANATTGVRSRTADTLKSTALGAGVGGAISSFMAEPGQSAAGGAVTGGLLGGAAGALASGKPRPIQGVSDQPAKPRYPMDIEGIPKAAPEVAVKQPPVLQQPPVLEPPVITPTEPAKPLTAAEAPKAAPSPVATSPKPVAATLGDHPNIGNAEAPVMLEKLGLPKHDEPSLATPTEGGLKSMSTANEALAKKAIMGRESPYLNMIDLPNGKEIKRIGYGDGFIIIKVKKPTLDKFQTYLYKGTLEEAQQIINSPKPYETFLKGIKVNNETSRVVDLHDRILTDAALNYEPPAPAPAGPLSSAPTPVAEKPALAAVAEQPKTEAQRILEAREQVITPEKAELANKPRLIEEEYTRKLKEESDKIIEELKAINDRLEGESKAKSEADVSALSGEEKSVQKKMDQVIEKHGISYDALARIRERMSPEEFSSYLDDRIKSEPTDISSAQDWINNIKEKITQNKADLDAKDQARVERAEDLIAAVEGEERLLRSPVGAEALKTDLAAQQEASKPKPLAAAPAPTPAPALSEKVTLEVPKEQPAASGVSQSPSDLVAQAKKLGIKIAPSSESIIVGKRSAIQEAAIKELKSQIEKAKGNPPEEPPAAPAVKEPTPPTPAPAGKFVPVEEKPATALAATEATPTPESAPKPAKSAAKPKKAVVKEPVEEQSPHEAMAEKVDEALVDPEVTKREIITMAKESKANGLITEAELEAIKGMSKDRDMGPEDVANEPKTTLRNRPLKKEAAAPVEEKGSKKTR
jgi:hypothetical protein